MLGLLGSLAGSAMSGVFGMMGQNSANEQMMQMDATKYQRATKDMMKAGLNPAMMYGSAGTPSSGPVLQNTMAAPASALKDAASSATQQMIADKTIDQLTSQIAKTNADTANVKAALPGVSADAGLKDLEFGDIKKIPSAVRIPIVQGGYGADKFKSLGKTGAGLGASVASAKGVGAALPTISISPPDFSSAKSWMRERAASARANHQRDKDRASAKRAEWRDWWYGKPANTTVIKKSY